MREDDLCAPHAADRVSTYCLAKQVVDQPARITLLLLYAAIIYWMVRAPDCPAARPAHIICHRQVCCTSAHRSGALAPVGSYLGRDTPPWGDPLLIRLFCPRPPVATLIKHAAHTGTEIFIARQQAGLRPTAAAFFKFRLIVLLKGTASGAMGLPISAACKSVDATNVIAPASEAGAVHLSALVSSRHSCHKFFSKLSQGRKLGAH